MSNKTTDNEIRILASEGWTRRNFMKIAAMAGGVAALSINGVALAASSLADKAKALGDGANLGDVLFIYSWADYANPDVLDAFSGGAGPRIQIATFDSVEAAIAKLQIAGGSAGYDIVVVGDAYVEQVIARELVQKLDHSKIPNLKNLRDQFRNLPFDPDNQYTVLKNFGTIGILYNNKIITEEIKNWDDFFRVAASKAASGRVCLLNDQPSVFGLVFWREGKDYNTGDEKKLREATDILIKDLVPHVKAFDARPVQGLLSGDYVIAQGYQGSCRHIFAQDAENYTWVYPEPQCVVWSDHYAVPTGAKNVDAAHAFINFMLDPDVAAAETGHIGYDTGVEGVIEKLPDDVIRKDLIVFPEGVLDRLIYQKVEGSNPTLRIDLFNEIKAAAARQ